VLGVLLFLGDWRPAFVITGTLGFLWLGAWRVLYYPPESHPRISEGERALILRDRVEVQEVDPRQRESRWRDLIKLPQTWAVIAARTMTDPVWFFITDWFAIYLLSKGINPEQGLLAFWIPFVAADLGNFFGGGLSSWLIRRGWPVIKARKAVVIFGVLGMTLLIPTIFTSNLLALAGLFAVSTFAYAAFSTMALVLPSDLYRSDSVATVSGMSGTGAGLGTIVSTFLIGYVSDHYSFEPILITASFIPFLGMILVLILIRQKDSNHAQA
jgi:ACS family hexuronate transporter-like MFS transporter